MRLLFLSAVNAARSQMAEGLAKVMLGEHSSVQSAGTDPGVVHPLAVEAMKDVSIDITAQTSKPIEDIDIRQVDTVIYLSPEAKCPVFLGHAIRINWDIPDPADFTGTQEEKLRRFREVREMLRSNLNKLVHPEKKIPMEA